MLTINGEKLRFIVNVAADPNSLQFDHFKELGRWISQIPCIRQTKVMNKKRPGQAAYDKVLIKKQFAHILFCGQFDLV